MHLVVVADTHLRAGIERLPAPLLAALDGADAIVHAGDVTSAAALEGFARLGPLHAVLGNNDRELVGVLPEELQIELGGVLVAVLHDSGPSQRRSARLAHRFPRAQVVVFGHSHVPLAGPGERGQLLFNPGSPTQRRRQPYPTFGRLRVVDGKVLDHEIVRLPLPGARSP